MSAPLAVVGLESELGASLCSERRDSLAAEIQQAELSQLVGWLVCWSGDVSCSSHELEWRQFVRHTS